MNRFDVIVVGAGPAGLCAGMYAGRGMLNAVVLERGVPGGELLNTEKIEDYPGFESLLGPDLAAKMEAHAKTFGADIRNENVEGIHRADGGGFRVTTSSGNEYLAPAVILTVFFHERSAGDIVTRIPGATLWVDREGVDKVESDVTNPFRPGDSLPGGLAAYATARSDEIVVWDPDSRSLFVGDVMLGPGRGGIELCPESWLPDGVGHADLKASLVPLLDLPIARILPGHGEPVLREAHPRLKRLLA